MRNKNFALFVVAILALFVVMTGCSQNRTFTHATERSQISESFPRMWIDYKGEKYTFVKVYSEKEAAAIQQDNLIDTGEVTGTGDGVESDLPIFKDTATNNLFVCSSYQNQKEWVEFKR